MPNCLSYFLCAVMCALWAKMQDTNTAALYLEIIYCKWTAFLDTKVMCIKEWGLLQTQIGNSMGNPQVSVSRPIPVPTKTRTHVPMGTVGRGTTHRFGKGTMGTADIMGIPVGILSNDRFASIYIGLF